MKYTNSLIMITILLYFSCNEETKVQQENISITKTNSINTLKTDSIIEPFKIKDTCLINYRKALKTDTIKGFKKNGEICFNFNLDTLVAKSPISSMQLSDITNSIDLVDCHPFFGWLNVEKIDTTKYQFTIKGNIPIYGWNANFKTFTLARYILVFKNDYYIFYEEVKYRFHYRYDICKLQQLENEIFSNNKCLSKDWEKAGDCFTLIENYEFQLFLSILNGKNENIDKFLNLKKTISIVNVGEFGEYHEGNKILLSIYNLIPKDKFDRRKWIWKNSSEIEKEIYCY